MFLFSLAACGDADATSGGSTEANVAIGEPGTPPNPPSGLTEDEEPTGQQGQAVLSVEDSDETATSPSDPADVSTSAATNEATQTEPSPAATTATPSSAPASSTAPASSSALASNTATTGKSRTSSSTTTAPEEQSPTTSGDEAISATEDDRVDIKLTATPAGDGLGALPPELAADVARLEPLTSLSNEQLEAIGSGMGKWVRVTLKPGTNVSEFIQTSLESPKVEYAEASPKPAPPPGG